MPFRDAWLLVGPFLVLLGFVSDVPALSGLGFVVIVIGAVSRYWGRHLFDGVAFRRRLHERRLFAGEATELEVELENRKLLPLPWFEWRLSVAEQLEVEGERLANAASPGLNLLTRRGSLGWYERQRWRFSVRSEQRGYHQVGPGRVAAADLFGLFPAVREDDVRERVVVYPRLLRLPELGFPAARALGDWRGRNVLFEDPLRFAGLREYQPTDPLRRIDWKASARLGSLTSRVYEPSATPHLYLLLNVDTLPHSWEGYLVDELEWTISVAASVAHWAVERGFAVGLLANGSLPDADRPIRLPPATAPDQLTRILEALAMVQPLTLQELAAVVRRESGRWPMGATVALVASLVPPELAEEVRRLQEQGHAVAAIATSERVERAILAPIPVTFLPLGSRVAGAERRW